MEKDVLNIVSDLCYKYEKEFNYKVNVINIKNICSITFFRNDIEIITNRYFKDYKYYNDKANIIPIKNILKNIIEFG